MKIELKLVRSAKSKGGDRYEAQLVGEDKPLVIYFPQYISRKDGVPKESITISVEV